MTPKEIIARRVAKEFSDGDIVNLGIGLPTMAASYVPDSVSLMFQAENGLMGMGEAANPENATNDCIDAGGTPITSVPGACFFDSATSFALIRGGHLDHTVLGAFEVSEFGDIANWIIPGKKVTGMGGAMDLLSGAKNVIVAMEHNNKNGDYKIRKSCLLPLTAAKKVSMIITNLAVIKIDQQKGLVLEEIAEGTTVEEVQKATEPTLIISENLKTMQI